jgi:hypothetical protein
MESLRIRDESVMAPLMEYALSDLRAGALLEGLKAETEESVPPEVRFRLSADVRDPKGRSLFRTFGEAEARANWKGGSEGSFGPIRFPEEGDPDSAALEEILRRIPTDSVEELLLAALGRFLGILPDPGKPGGRNREWGPEDLDRVREAVAANPRRPSSERSRSPETEKRDDPDGIIPDPGPSAPEGRFPEF